MTGQRACFVAGLVLGCAGLAGLWTDLRLALGGKVAQATVVRVEHGRATYAYSDEREPGSSYEATAPLSRDAPLSPGDRVAVLYLAANPDVSRPRGAWARWPLALLALAAAAGAAGLWLRRGSEPR